MRNSLTVTKVGGVSAWLFINKGIKKRGFGASLAHIIKKWG
jgi:hypothetical protein